MEEENQYYTLHPMNTRFISDGLGEDYKEWKTAEITTWSTRVYLESPTGTGKTYFLLNKLLPFAMENRRPIIYVCNRDALRKQLEKSLDACPLNLKKRPARAGCPFSMYDSPDNRGAIAIVNYHSLRNFEKEIFPIPYYVFFDEVHFFFEDAMFNQNTAKLLGHILDTYWRQVQIFTSATIREFLDLYRNTFREPALGHLSSTHDTIRHFPEEHYQNSYANPVFNVIFYVSVRDKYW